ncbi:MAG: hypothetical protein QOC83_2017, partial [Pseudonocardiales bacterium]|nr:hypothetical protein [Pseudonocardiales bacterium]
MSTAVTTRATTGSPTAVPLGRRVLDAGPVLALVLLVAVF